MAVARKDLLNLGLVINLESESDVYFQRCCLKSFLLYGPMLRKINKILKK